MRVDGVDWYWPADEDPAAAGEADDAVRLLAPFDPVVWDRRRFELLWSWPYRFEAYTPVARRQWGYYALPLLWRDRVIGWANASVVGAALRLDVGYVAGRAPRVAGSVRLSTRSASGWLCSSGSASGSSHIPGIHANLTGRSPLAEDWATMSRSHCGA